MKFPFIKFFPRDWMGDERVRLCSVAARGLWIDMLCLMHSAHRRGYLQTATGSPLPLEQIARMAGCSTDEVTRLLSELKDAGVYDCSGNGTIYSRRMVRENDISQVRSANGKRGADSKYGVCDGKPAGKPAGKSTAKPLAKTSPSESQKRRDSDQEDPTGGAAAEPQPVAESPAKPPLEKKPPSGPHAEAIRIFCDLWAELHGEKYPFAGGKDAAAVKSILARIGGDLDKFRAVSVRYFANSEPFFAGHSLAKLNGDLSRFIADGPPPRASYRGGFQTHDDRVMGDIYDALRDAT
jgi:biotin operon repressor